jgi:3-oxoacyl-[acyl-carrier protein] reductase
MEAKLAGRVAIVTGAGQGIGRAIATKLAREGAALLANDLDEQALEETVAIIRGNGGRAESLPGDVTADGFAESLVDGAVEKLGGLHIVVNNAGYIWNGALHNQSDAQWDAMLDIHAKTPFRILRAAGRYFRDQVKREQEAGENVTRKIVNISSVSGVEGAATQSSYSAGKMAVVGLTRTLAKEWGRLGITVNAVAFGPIETRLIGEFEDEPGQIEIKGRQHRVGLSREHRELIAATASLGRLGTVEEAAGAVYLMCIPESDYITGQVLVCAGGATL